MTTYKSPLADVFRPATQIQYSVVFLSSLMASQRRCGVIPEYTQPLLDEYLQTIEKANSLSELVDLVLLEQLTEEYHHETAALVDAWRESLPEGLVPYSYLGATSSNVIDCSMAAAARQYTQDLEELADRASKATDRVVTKLNGNLREGRTHGRVAYPVTVQATYDRFDTNLHYGLGMLTQMAPPGACAGPTGDYTTSTAAILPEVAHDVGTCMGISMDYTPTQLANRQLWLDFAYGLYRIVATCEQLATYHRLEATRDRFAEEFDEGKQKGSSSMPHKNNPIRSERICGLARVARGHLHALMETATSGWWERDLTNSSVEKTSLVGLADLAAFCLTETCEILENCEISGDYHLPEEAWSNAYLVGKQLEGEDPRQAYRDLQAKDRYDD